MYFRRLHYYHLKIETNSREDYFFVDNSDYQNFLLLMSKKIIPNLRILCYNLLPQRYEFILYTGDGKRVRNSIKGTARFTSFSKQISNCIRRFHISYCRYFNLKHGRRGSLFREKPIAYELQSIEHVSNCIINLHNRPKEAGFCDKVESWEFSSYKVILESVDNSFIWQTRILEIFGGIEEFIKQHNTL